MSSDDAALWKRKFEYMNESYQVALQKNAELEERILTVVEKVEGDKLILSQEIDHLAHCLTNANSRIAALEDDCARYKKDCALAASLLRCAPSSHYITGPGAISSTSSGGCSSSLCGTTPLVEFECEPDDPTQQECDLSMGSEEESMALAEDVAKVRISESKCQKECKACGAPVHLSPGKCTSANNVPRARGISDASDVSII